MKPAAIVISATLALVLGIAGCGGSDQKTYKVKDPETGNTVEVQTSSNNQTMTITGEDENGAPVSVTVTEGYQEGALPDWLPLYPGANVESAMTGGPAGEQGALVSFTVDDSPSDVAAFYAEKVKAAGVVEMMQASAGETIMLGGELPDGSGVSLSFNPDGEGGTYASVTYVGKP
jgi:hypothetical protein